MKKALLKNIPVIALLAAFAIATNSCNKKDPTYDVVVTVKYLSDTMMLVKNAAVVIEKNDIRKEGITDVVGEFKTDFKLEAILNVHASIDTGTVGIPHLLYGASTIRLQENKTVYRTVFVSP